MISPKLMPSHSTRSEEEPDLNISDVTRIILRRAWLLGSSIAVFLAFACIYLLIAKRRYQADAELQLLGQKPSSSISDFTAGDSDTSALQLSVTMQTYVGILTSERLALQVIDELHLEQLPEFHVMPIEGEENRPLALATHRREEVLKRFKKDLMVSAESGSRLLSVSFRSTSPDVARQVLDRLIEDFVGYNSTVRRNNSMQTELGLGKQLGNLRAQVQREEEMAQQAQHDTGVYGADASRNVVVTRLEALQMQLANAEQNRIVKGSVYELVRNGGPEAVSNLSNAPGQATAPGGIDSLALLETFHRREAELSTQEAELASTFGSAYPPLVSVQKQLAAVRQSRATESERLIASAAGDYRAAVLQETALRREVERQTALANQSNDAATRYLIANRQAAATRGLYEHLLERSEELGVVADLQSNDVEVVDSAYVGTAAKPAIVKTLLAGAGAGFVFGLCAVFLWDGMDRTLYAPELAQTLSGLPILGIIPLARGKMADSAPEMTEAFRFVAASTFLLPSIPLKTVMITSAAPGDGKSFVALHIALLLTRAGHPTLVVDTDWRDGALGRQLYSQPEPVAGTTPVATAARGGSDPVPIVRDGVAVVSVGAFGSDPIASSASERMASLLARWGVSYEYILLKTAPLAATPEALLLARLVDGVIVVSRASATNRTSFSRACEHLKQAKAPLLGTIFNALPSNSPEYRHSMGKTRNFR